MIKLLIADDEKIIRETISTIIDWSSLGIRIVGLAKDGIEAYHIILDESPDIVLTDIKMPGISGLELIEKIYETNRRTQFIILSGYNEFEYAKTAMKFGVRHYLLKPCNENQIINSVKEIMLNLSNIKAFAQIKKEKKLLLKNLHTNYMINIINEGLATIYSSPANRLSTSYEKYEKFIDFSHTAYEIFFLYFLEKSNLASTINQLESFRKQSSPNISYNYLYVQNTLFFFFPSYKNNYADLSGFMNSISTPKHSPSSPETDLEISHKTYPNLSLLLDQQLKKIARFETIIYSNGDSFTTISNYKNVITQMITYSSQLFSTDAALSTTGYQAILDLLASIQDVGLLKQLISSLIIHATATSICYHTITATEFLLKIDAITTCQEILSLFAIEFQIIYTNHHSTHSKGALSDKIKQYILEHIAESNLSLKYISENCLYMNQDYVSKKFLKETGQKFSDYLTGFRIEQAKQLMAHNRHQQIQEVANAVGFGNNPQYFSIIFKKCTGYTPSGYMKFIHPE